MEAGQWGNTAKFTENAVVELWFKERGIFEVKSTDRGDTVCGLFNLVFFEG